jgi:GNAT superfamily N-acetyltransferase
MVLTLHSSREIRKEKDAIASINEIFIFVKESFPSFTIDEFNLINRGKRFKEWIYGMDGDKIVCCTAIFIRDIGCRFGMFCVSPSHRREGIGKQLFDYLYERYRFLEWTALSNDSLAFYEKVGGKAVGTERGKNGIKYILFNKSPYNS